MANAWFGVVWLYDIHCDQSVPTRPRKLRKSLERKIGTPLLDQRKLLASKLAVRIID